MRKNRIPVAGLVVCSFYSFLQENPVAKLVSDPWFCAAVTSQVGLGAHFFSFTSFLRDSQCWECSHPVRRSGLGAEGRAGGAKGGLKESLNLRRA